MSGIGARVVAAALAAIAALGARPGLSAAPAEPEPVPGSRAADHVGKQVTIEGRVFATHASPLATVLAFAPNFAGFTATILAADRAKFPADLEERYQGKTVRVTGLVTAYRGKPEMTIREPAQLQVLMAPGETPAPPGRTSGPTPPSPSPDAAMEDIRRSLAVIDDRLSALEARLATIEQTLAAQASAARPSREARLSEGLSAADVRMLLGNPVEVTRGIQGKSRWIYGTGRSVTFDRDGRVLSWSGF